jgi:hypothetical protein
MKAHPMDVPKFRVINAQVPYFVSRFQENSIPIIDKFDTVIRGMGK